MVGRIINGYVRFVGLLTLVGVTLSATAILMILGLVCLEVFLRTFLGTSTMIADEMSGYLNVAVIYLGLAYTLADGAFVRVDVVYQKLKGPGAALARWFVGLMSIGYIAVLLYYMAKHVAYSYHGDLRSAQLSQTPLYLPQSLIVIGLLLLLLQLSAYLLQRFRNLP